MLAGMPHSVWMEWQAYARYRAADWARRTNKGKKGQLVDPW